MTATFEGWTRTNKPARNVDSPLAKLVAEMPVNDEGTDRLEVIFNGHTVPEDFPMADVLNKIAANEDITQGDNESDDDFEDRSNEASAWTNRALRQANAIIKELYRAAGQLQPRAFVRARKAKLVDGRYAVSAWRATSQSTRGRKANGGEDEDGGE